MKNTTITLPELKAGQTYAGLVIDDKGSMHHLILLDGDADDAPHQEQLDWAKSIGGELPTRQEQALLYANCKAQFKADWYWSGEAPASDSGYAWCQNFNNGNQNNNDINNKLRARAVRRSIRSATTRLHLPRAGLGVLRLSPVEAQQRQRAGLSRFAQLPGPRRPLQIEMNEKPRPRRPTAR